MFNDIENSTTWVHVEKINKGWSSDEKYYIETAEGAKLLLRLSDIKSYEMKRKEYEILSLYKSLGFQMSQPIQFGTCHQNQKVYMLLSFIEGIDLEEALPTLPAATQYELGRKAGKILKQIHSLEIDEKHIPITTKLPKKLEQIQRYMSSNVRVEHDEVALQYITMNVDKMYSHGPAYLHGDFHPGNLIYTPNGDIGVIDFNRYEIGDPYEEFYKLESFGVEVSIPYCIGQIEAYFDDKVPLEFFETVAVYVAHASLFSIKWAEKFGQTEVDGMVKRWLMAFDHYDGFKSVIPSWYQLKR